MTNKRFLSGRLLPLWIALSAVVIAVGIVMMAIFGFNYVSSKQKTVEVSYDAIVVIEKKEEALQTLCEQTFRENGLSYTEFHTNDELDTSYGASTGTRHLVFSFSSDADRTALAKAAANLNEKIASDASFANADIFVAAHTIAGEKFYEPAWRGGVALGTAVILVLVYVGFRFGIGNAIAGLAACVNDGLFAVSILAFTRIPVYAYTPVLLAGFAAAVSLLVWILQCVRMKDHFKDPSYSSLSAQEAVGESCRHSLKFILAVLGALAIPLVIFGVCGIFGALGLALFPLTALIPLVVSLYSSFLLAPAVLVPLKKKFDKLKIRRRRYSGKKKEDSAETQE